MSMLLETLAVETNVASRSIHRHPVLSIGMWASVLSAVFAMGYSIAQILAWFKLIPPAAEPFWLFLPSLFLGPAFLITMSCLHFVAPKQLRIYTFIGVVFAIVYCSFATMTYSSQLGSVLPALSRGEIDNSYPFIMKPRSFLMTIDCLGYVFMSISTLFAGFAFRPLEKRLFRWMFWNGMVAAVFIPGYFNTFFYYLASPWILTFLMSMIYAWKLFYNNRRVSLHQ